MGIDSLNKDTSGASLVNNFKDIFPGKLEKLYIYRGTNLVSKGNEVFSREDTKTFIALELIKEVDIIYGGQAMTSTVRTITESKSVKETARQKISTDSLTAFFRDLGDEVDLTEHNLYYTVKAPFIQGDLTQDQLEVLSDAQIVPNLLEKLISGAAAISTVQKNTILNNKTASFTLSPAVLDNNLPASEVRFVDANIYKVLPTEEKDFEITSIDIESDQSLALEYKNGIKARGVLENEIGRMIEDDIDFKMDKPLLPIQINPYAKFGNIQFEIQNFNYYQRMPFLSAKHFLSDDRSITTFIIGELDVSKPENLYAKELAEAIVDMFEMSWAISTGYADYDTDKDSIGGVALKSMVGKDPEKLYPYVDQILGNWEYKRNVKNKETEAYKRALQVLASSSEVLQSSYCVGKGLTQFHKTIFDFWLNLNTIITKGVDDIEMTLSSTKYIFTYEESSPGIPDLTKPFINLSPILSISRAEVTNFGRLTSLAELDDPISITGFTNFAGDIDPTKADATKYFVGIDITDQKQIADFLGATGKDITAPQTVNKEIDSPWYGQDVDTILNSGSVLRTISSGSSFSGVPVESLGTWETRSSNIGSYNVPAPKQDDVDWQQAIKDYIDIPKGAYDIQINFSNVKEVFNKTSLHHDIIFGSSNPKPEGPKFTTNLVKYTGTVVTYKIMTTTHGVIDKKQTYDKGQFINMVTNFAGTDVWKRNLSIDDNFRNENGDPTSKIKSINHIFISSFLGNYIDIKLNYKYKDVDDNEQTGTTLLPRIDLPAKDDERRTKLGIRL